MDSCKVSRAAGAVPTRLFTPLHTPCSEAWTVVVVVVLWWWCRRRAAFCVHRLYLRFINRKVLLHTLTT